MKVQGLPHGLTPWHAHIRQLNSQFEEAETTELSVSTLLINQG